jgi:hypothetical protein
MMKRRAGRGPPRLQPEVALFFLRLDLVFGFAPPRTVARESLCAASVQPSQGPLLSSSAPPFCGLTRGDKLDAMRLPCT